jgi:hypothetical protein
MTTATEKIVENKLITVLARASMILATPLLGALITIGGWYLNSQAEASAAVGARVTMVETTQAIHAQDIALLKQSNASDQIRRDRDQAEIKAQLERLQISVTQLSSSVAALTAVLDAERRGNR